jgi:predicted dehydrogenase
LPGIIQVQDYVRNGVLGEMHHVISVRAIPPRSRSWIDDAVLHHAAHHVDLLLHWFGSVTPVACVGYPQTEGAQDAALIAQLANGAPVNVSVSYTCRIQETRLTCVGADHTVTTDGFSFIESDNGVFTWRGDAQGSYEAAVQKQDRAFVESCSGGAPAVPWRDTIRLAECLDVFRNKGRPG